MNNKRVLVWAAAAVLLMGLSGGGYYFFRNFTITKQQRAATMPEPREALPGQQVDVMTVRIFNPAGGRIEVVERTIPRRIRTSAIAEAVIEEYFRLPVNAAGSPIPANVKLLGLYRDAMQILYIDLSDEVRRNFHGDAASEYLLLKGLLETVVSNITDIQDVKVLVEGKEIDSLGGHVMLKYPLKNLVSGEVKGEVKISSEQ